MLSWREIVSFVSGLRAKYLVIDGDGTLDLMHNPNEPAAPEAGYHRLFTNGDARLMFKTPAGVVGYVGDGAEGTHWYSGAGVPSLEAVENDFYVNIDNGDIYQHGGEDWALLCNLRGAKWLSGSGLCDPAVGLINDFYMNLDNGDIFQKTGVTTWARVASFISEGEAKGYTNFVGNVEGGNASSNYGGVPLIDGGKCNSAFGSAAVNYLHEFNATDDWSADDDEWVVVVTALTHGRGLWPVVQVRDAFGGVVDPDTTVAGNGDVTIRVASGDRFAGSLVIQN